MFRFTPAMYTSTRAVLPEGLRSPDSSHTYVIVGGEPVVRCKLIRWVAHNRVETAAENGALAGKDWQTMVLNTRRGPWLMP